MKQSITVSGRMVKDATLKKVPTADGEKFVLSGTVAYNTRASTGVTDKGEKDHSNFADIQIWGKQAETLASRLVKGIPVIAEGEPLLKRYTTSEGKRGVQFLINADTIDVRALPPKAETAQA